MYFNLVPNSSKATPAIHYVWDRDFVSYGHTGVFRPIEIEDSKLTNFVDFSGDFSTGAAYVFDNSYGYSSIGFRLNIPSGGTAFFQGSFDGEHWNATTLRQIGQDGYLTHTETSNGYIGSISTLKYFRVSLSGSSEGGSLSGRTDRSANTLEGIEHGFAPHRIGFKLVHKDFNFSSNQTGVSVWTPESGKKFVVTDLHYSADGSNNAIVTLYDEIRQQGRIVSQLRLIPQSNQGMVISQSFSTPFVSAAENNSLKIMISGEPYVLGVIHGYEISNGLT